MTPKFPQGDGLELAGRLVVGFSPQSVQECHDWIILTLEFVDCLAVARGAGLLYTGGNILRGHDRRSGIAATAEIRIGTIRIGILNASGPGDTGNLVIAEERIRHEVDGVQTAP